MDINPKLFLITKLSKINLLKNFEKSIVFSHTSWKPGVTIYLRIFSH